MVVTTEGTDVLADLYPAREDPREVPMTKEIWELLGEGEGVLGVDKGALEI